jgi:hypothetical protein
MMVTEALKSCQATKQLLQYKPGDGRSPVIQTRNMEWKTTGPKDFIYLVAKFSYAEVEHLRDPDQNTVVAKASSTYLLHYFQVRLV